MADRDPIEQLDQALAALPADNAIAELVAVAVALRDLPRQSFRRQLGAELMKAANRAGKRSDERSEEKAMSTAAVNPIPAGFHTITPYLVVKGAARLIDFMKQAFGAEERLRVPLADGSIMHAELNIAGSMLELGDGNAQHPASEVALHFYVEDADATYKRALDAGAVSKHEPINQPYGDREASIQDPSGNFWYIATHLQPENPEAKHIPAGLRSITPYLHVHGADQVIDFMKRGLQAEEVAVYRSPDGTVVHATIRIGDSAIELSEAHGPYQPMPTNLHVYTEDTDAWYRRALEAGATSVREPTDEPYGDRTAGVKDAFGNQWWFATHVRDVEYGSAS